MNRTKIMLVMEPIAFRDKLIMQMGHEGFEVYVASSGHEALNKLRECSVDEIVTQLNLPQFDGLELILNIRDLRLDIPIIAISFNESEMVKEVLKAGATMLLHNPVDPSAVIDLIKNSVDSNYGKKTGGFR